jgi:transcriptional regulator with XRE-family HTH domain
MHKELVAEIVQRRKELGWSTQQMADKLGVSGYGYRRLEAGENVCVGTFFKALEVLGFGIDLVVD